MSDYILRCPGCGEEMPVSFWFTSADQHDDEHGYVCCSTCISDFTKLSGIPVDRWERFHTPQEWGRYPEKSWGPSLARTSHLQQAPVKVKAKAPVEAKATAPVEAKATAHKRKREEHDEHEHFVIIPHNALPRLPTVPQRKLRETGETRLSTENRRSLNRALAKLDKLDTWIATVLVETRHVRKVVNDILHS